MLRTACLGALLLLTLSAGPAAASWPSVNLNRLNNRLAGRVIDHTNNHGADRRIWSLTLQDRRALYVYLPPGYDPCKRYPALLWLHGINQDEQDFLQRGWMEAFDSAIACGRLPPTIIVVPDGSKRGRGTLFGPNPLFLNSDVGPFEDYLIRDIWCFVRSQYPIRPERGRTWSAGSPAAAGRHSASASSTGRSSASPSACCRRSTSAGWIATAATGHLLTRTAGAGARNSAAVWSRWGGFTAS